MSHYTQVRRKARLDRVRIQLASHGTREVIEYCIKVFGCSRRKAIEYIAEVTRE